MEEQISLEEGLVVSATESPEAVVREFMSEERKKELVDRLKNLKETLEHFETVSTSLVEVRLKEQEVFKPLKKLEKEELAEIFGRINLLTNISADLRANLNTLANSDKHDEFMNTLEVLIKTTNIYERIIDQLSQ